MATAPLPKDNPNTITITSDGNWTPVGGVRINKSGKVQFDVDSYPTGYNECIIGFTISWGNQPARLTKDPGGTVKVGS